MPSRSFAETDEPSTRFGNQIVREKEDEAVNVLSVES